MSIVRERDTKFAKRRIPEIEYEIYKHESKIDDLQGELNSMEAELENLKTIVEENEPVPVPRPCDVERPANEASLDQWVSA